MAWARQSRFPRISAKQRPPVRQRATKPSPRRYSSVSRTLSALILFLSLCRCAGPLDSAQEAFDVGRYPEALDELRRVEPAACKAAADTRRRYALYRGLAHLAVGDVRAAQTWLALVKREWDRDPTVLDAQTQGQLLAAWQSMGYLPGETPP